MLASPDKTMNGTRPDCWKCQHFAVSWDPKLPYLCRLMGFKSRSLPALEIIRVDGKPCQGFALKPQPAAAQSNPSIQLSGLRR
jgi:hypothetical protein